MPRKLKKQKIRAAARQQVAVPTIQEHAHVQSMYTFSSTAYVPPQGSTALSDPTLQFVKKDLVKTVILSFVAIGVIVYLYVRMQ